MLLAEDLALEVFNNEKQTIEEYLALKEQAAQIEAKLKAIKRTIEETMSVGSACAYGGYKVTL